MLKRYSYNGTFYQYEEGTQPAGAIEVKPAEAKAAQPDNKAAVVENKAPRKKRRPKTVD